MRQRSFSRCAALILVLGCATAVMAQSGWQPGHASIGFGQAKGKQSVQMVSSPDVILKAGTSPRRPQELTLRFVIQSGLHVNSHTPHSRFLIPTTLTFDQPGGSEIGKVIYPPGVDYHFSFAPKDAVSVYTDQFSLLVQLRSRTGRYSLHGQLHYQACDDRACNPPRTLPVTVNVTAR
jgi:hypothetical protein